MRMNGEYQDYIDESYDTYDQHQDIEDSQLDQYEGYPQAKEKSDLFSWFWKVVRTNKPLHLTRAANLRNDEVGETFISMRDALKLYQLGIVFNHPTFGKFWANQSKIIASTSMGRKGWFMELSISQKKLRGRTSSGDSSSSQSKGWRLFNKGSSSQGSQEGQ